MDIEKVIQGRRGIRKFLSVPVEKEKIGKILEAGSLAPCAGNIQNWRFIVVQNNEKKSRIADACLEQEWVATAPTILVVCSDMSKITKYYGLRAEKLYSIQNCAAAIENMLLEITNLGLGSAWVGAFEEQAVKRILEIPDSVRVQAILPIGYPNEKPVKPMKLKLFELTFFESYGERKTNMDEFMRDTHYAERIIDSTKSFLKKSKK